MRASRGARDPARAELDAEILDWMREAEWREDEGRFERLALALFAFQFEHCAAYRSFCEGRGRTPGRVRSWRDVPPVPSGAFKELALRCFPAERTVVSFRTSGTATSARGALHLDTLELYEGSLLPSFRRHLLPDLPAGERVLLLVLAPPPEEAPDSSLTHMFAVAIRELGAPGSAFQVKAGELAADRVLRDLREAEASGTPVVLCGTAFAFVHLLDELERRGVRAALPSGSRLMETGGFKGRSRELSRAELYADLAEALGVPESRMLNQYGMTELGSQFYDSVLLQPGEPRRKLAPPWTRVAIVDPRNGAGVRVGETGAIVVVDLANTGSVLAIQTADVGRALRDGFEVLGREPGAEQRGCSIAADELLRANP